MAERSSEKFEGVFNGEKVSVFREFGGHRMTDGEVAALLRGEHIAFDAVSSKTGNHYQARGHLEKGERFVKFVLDFDSDYEGPYYVEAGSEKPPKSWCGHVFTADELATLETGARVHGQFHSKNTGNDFECDVVWEVDDDSGLRRIVPKFE